MVVMAPAHPRNFPDLGALSASSVPALCEWYAELCGQPPPPRASRAFLEGNIAWALQAHAQHKDPATLRGRLAKAVSRPLGRTPPRYSPGTRLVREWQGAVYEVTILPKGYLWQGGSYRSLSRIAEEITGTRWSGPRFFGTKGPTP